MCDFLFCRGAEISLPTGAVHLFGKLRTSSSFTSKSFSILDARQAVVSLAPVRKNNSRTKVLLLFFVGVPRIELGPYVPKTYILPIYYTPLQCLQILS